MNIVRMNKEYRNKAKRSRGSYLSFSWKISQGRKEIRRDRRVLQNQLLYYCKPSSNFHDRHSLSRYNSPRTNSHLLHPSHMFTSIIMGTPRIKIDRISIRGTKVSLETINKDLKDNAEVLLYVMGATRKDILRKIV